MFIYQAEVDLVLEPHETRNKMGRLCVQGEVRTQLTEYKLKSKILNEQGPGGGNPLVRIRGPRKQIKRWLHEVYQANDGHPIERVWVGKSPTAAQA